MNKRTVVFYFVLLTLTISSSLLLGGCGGGVRAGYNGDDLQESRKVAEQFLQNLKDSDYGAAYQLGASRLKSLVTQQSLQGDIQGRLQGGTVQNWVLKSHQIKEGIPRYIALLYHVQGSKTAGDWELTMELMERPYQWRIWSVRTLNNAQTDQNARAARVVAERFLGHLTVHLYSPAHQLLSPKGKSTTTQALQSLWQEMEKRKGAVSGWTLKGYDDTTATFTGKRQSYTMLVYQVRGSQANGGIVFTMIKIGAVWRIEGVQFRDSLPGLS